MRFAFPALLFELCCLGTFAAQRGVVTGVRASAPSVKTGATMSVTVTGSNPCGAANVDYGDGTAITYAITGLPTTHEHAYQTPGAYTIVARGEGNCDGQASTKIEVKGAPSPTPPQPPAPPPPAPGPQPQITAVNLTPSPARTREPVTIDVEGRGTCTFSIDFGDGNKQTFEGTLPRKVAHAFGAPDKYTLIVRPAAPCVGKFTQQLVIADRARPAITDLRADPSPADVRQAVTITVGGTGTCSYNVDFGDGNADSRSERLPHRIQHVYTAADRYTIAVTGTGDCTGGARTVLVVQ